MKVVIWIYIKTLYVKWCSWTSLTTCILTHLLLVTTMNLNGMDERMTSELWEMSPASHSPPSPDMLARVCFLWFALVSAVPVTWLKSLQIKLTQEPKEGVFQCVCVCGCFSMKRIRRQSEWIQQKPLMELSRRPPLDLERGLCLPSASKCF